MDNKNVKYTEKEKLKFRNKEDSSSNSKSTGNLCSACSHVNDTGAMFCSECGSGLSQAVVCPNCNAVARPFADICESCQTWLLKGQCMFCYAPVGDNEKFCRDCGSSTSGIECPQCKKNSIFDFCKTCCIPLSNQAQELMQESKSNEIFQEINALIKDIGSISNLTDEKGYSANKKTVDPKEYEQYLKLKAYKESLNKPTVQQEERKQVKSLFSQKQKEQINQLHMQINEEEDRVERARIEAEEKKRLLLDQFQKAMNQLPNKKFSSHQDARRFYMSVLAQFPQEFIAKGDTSIGWRCNAYDTFHHNGPSGCASPESGGAWIFE